MGERLFESIESDRFSATMNVVSGLKPFVRAISSSNEFQELLASLRSDADLAAVVMRFNEIADRQTDPALECPWDVAMASYLLVLNRVDQRQSRLLSRTGTNAFERLVVQEDCGRDPLRES